MENNAGSYNILEDDKYADVFIDLENTEVMFFPILKSLEFIA